MYDFVNFTTLFFFCGGGVHTIFSCVHFHAASAERGRNFVGRIDESNVELRYHGGFVITPHARRACGHGGGRRPEDAESV